MKFLSIFILTLYVLYETVVCSKESQVLLSNKEIREILKCFGDLNLEEGCVICRYITQKISMCPDIVETKLMYEREREWKPDPQVINKWTVLYNLQKDYLQRIKPSIDGMKNYQDVLTEKIKKEKQEKENLQNLIQFQNKVNSDLRKTDNIKNNSFDSDDKKCDDEDLKYKNNKIIAPAKNNNYLNENSNNKDNSDSKKYEVNILAQKNNIDENSNDKNDLNNNTNYNNQNASDKPNLFAFNKKLFTDFKNNNDSANKHNTNNNNNAHTNSQQYSERNNINQNEQSDNKLDESNKNKLKSAMASFLNKDDKATTFKFSERNSEITNENQVNGKKQRGLSIEDPEIMDIDLTKDGAKSSIDFQKIIQNIKLNEGEEIEYLGTSIGSPYDNEEGNSNYKKIDSKKINKNSEIHLPNNHKANKNTVLTKFNSMNRFNKNLKSSNSKSSRYNNIKTHKTSQKIEREKLMEQAKNINNRLQVKSIFDQNSKIKDDMKSFIGKNLTKPESNRNINHNIIPNKTQDFGESNKLNMTINKENSILNNELNIYAKNIQFEDNSLKKENDNSKTNPKNYNNQKPNNNLNNNGFDDIQINYLQTKNENKINSDDNRNQYKNDFNVYNKVNNQQRFDNLHSSYEQLEMNRLAKTNYVKNFNPNMNDYNENKLNMNKHSNISNNFYNSQNSNFPNKNILNQNPSGNYNFNNQKINAQMFDYNSLNNKNTNNLNNKFSNINNQKEANYNPIAPELSNLDLSEDNQLNREIKKRLDKIQKLEMLNNSPSFNDKKISESETILNNYENENSNFPNVAQRIANPPSSFLELSQNNFDKNLFENLIKKSENYNLETQRRGRRRSRFPDPQWDCAETQIAKLVRYLCEEEVSSSYQKYCKPIFEQINTMIESYLYHDNNLEICQNLHMCPVSVDI